MTTATRSGENAPHDDEAFRKAAAEGLAEALTSQGLTLVPIDLLGAALAVADADPVDPAAIADLKALVEAWRAAHTETIMDAVAPEPDVDQMTPEPVEGQVYGG
jgi:hypothetical protein